MEQINKIELRGNVGKIDIRKVDDRQVANIFLATNYVFRGKDGDPVIDTTWHNITAWDNNKNMPDFTKIKKGDCLHVFGRMKMNRYEDDEGVEKTAYEVVAYHIELEDRTAPVQYGL